MLKSLELFGREVIPEQVPAWSRQDQADQLPQRLVAAHLRPGQALVFGFDISRAAITRLGSAETARDSRVEASPDLTPSSPESWRVRSLALAAAVLSTGDPPLPAVLYFDGCPHNPVSRVQ
jgi:hypothetical protein